jgi:hypothetical protein
MAQYIGYLYISRKPMIQLEGEYMICRLGGVVISMLSTRP